MRLPVFLLVLLIFASVLLAQYDRFENDLPLVRDPARNASAINLASDTTLANVSRGVYVGVSGDLVVDMADTGTQVTFANLAAGVIHPIRVDVIYSTANGTSATDVVVVY